MDEREQPARWNVSCRLILCRWHFEKQNNKIEGWCFPDVSGLVTQTQSERFLYSQTQGHKVYLCKSLPLLQAVRTERSNFTLKENSKQSSFIWSQPLSDQICSSHSMHFYHLLAKLCHAVKLVNAVQWTSSESLLKHLINLPLTMSDGILHERTISCQS